MIQPLTLLQRSFRKGSFDGHFGLRIYFRSRIRDYMNSFRLVLSNFFTNSGVAEFSFVKKISLSGKSDLFIDISI